MNELFLQQMRELLKDCCSDVSPRIFNQALMELGALVCVPNGAPNCEICPWKDLCEARKMELTDRIPVRAKKKERRKEEKTVLLIRDGDKIALHKRPSKGLLAGLYEFLCSRSLISSASILCSSRSSPTWNGI